VSSTQLVQVSNKINDGYRFGYNGQEKVDEIAGAGNHNTAEFWEYDTRLGRRWNRDLIVKSSESPYLCFGGNPILYSDPKGDDYGITTKKDKDGKITNIKVSAVIYIQGSGASADEATKLTKGAKDTYKTKTVNGVEVSFDVQYVFDPNKKVSDLNAKKGENLLVLTNNTTDRSHVNSFTYQGSDFEFTGHTGVVTKYSGNRTYSTLHETLHLLGLSDRYNKNFPNPDKGYEKDIMGKSLSFNLSISHYKNIIDYAKRQHELLTPQYPNLKFVYSNHFLDLKYDRVNGKLKTTLKR
jgi:hypothetical protein